MLKRILSVLTFLLLAPIPVCAAVIFAGTWTVTAPWSIASVTQSPSVDAVALNAGMTNGTLTYVLTNPNVYTDSKGANDRVNVRVLGADGFGPLTGGSLTVLSVIANNGGGSMVTVGNNQFFTTPSANFVGTEFKPTFGQTYTVSVRFTFANGTQWVSPTSLQALAGDIP